MADQRASRTVSARGKKPGSSSAPSKGARASSAGARAGNGPSRRAIALKWAKRAGIAFAALTLLGMAGLVGIFWYYGRDLPTVESLRSYRPPQITRVVDRDGEVIGEIFVERRTVVPMERIPRELVWSVLAAEDADFYEHKGLDYPGIMRAIFRDVLSGRPAQGASTITQQVVKIMLLSPERTISRKVRELILARRLEQELTKDEILHLYLNHINFGHGRYGVQEAARYYFGKDVQELTLAEASLIAGVPQAPGRLSPRTHPDAARRRQRYVLDQLAAKRAEYWPTLPADAIAAAREVIPELAPAPERTEAAPEVMAIARRVLREQVGDEAYRQGGFTVQTTIDLDLQRATREAVRGGLGALDARHGHRGPIELPRRRRNRPLARVDALRSGRTYDAVVTGADDEAGLLELDVGGHAAVVDLADAVRYNPESLPPSRFAERGARVRVSIEELPENADANERVRARLELGPQGAAIVIDPRTREVLALVGGHDADPGFDRATQAVRQPGSSFKPLVYALAIKSRRFTPASIVLDAPAVYDQWQPQNFETWRYEGAVRIRDAVARSINLVAVRVMEDLSPPEVVSFAQRLGITTEMDPSLALALGASDVRLIELANAFATFAAGGRWEQVRTIRRIDGPGGRRVELAAPEPPRDVLTPAEAYVVTSMLTSVVDAGTATAAKRLRRPAAGKTGTSNEARDAWFVGYTPSVVAGVWVGFDDRRSLGRRESGARAALPIWIDVIRAAEGDRPPADFPVPSGVVTARIDPATGLLAYEGMEGAVDEVFLEGTQPTETAPPPGVLDPSSFLMEQVGGGTQQPAPAPAEPPPAEGP